jgi:hypothetical protein
MSYRFLAACALVAWPFFAQTHHAGHTTPVTVDNFTRAETDKYFSEVALEQGGFGKFHHFRELMPVEHQPVIRPNRDTLYSAAVFDLDAGPVTITLPDAGKRFRSLMVLDEDQYVVQVVYNQGSYTFSKDKVGTRYAFAGLRIFVDPAHPNDLDDVHKLQDATQVSQASPGRFEVPHWDQASRTKIHDALLVLASTMSSFDGAFGTRAQVDPVKHFIGTAAAWGGNPRDAAIYLNFTPAKDDGVTVYKLHVKDVPVDGFWSISLYNAKGYFQPNQYNAYSLNNVTAKRSADGSIDIQFGGCDGHIANCLPTVAGWNYAVRLYRPRAEILNGSWKFPEAQPVL